MASPLNAAVWTGLVGAAGTLASALWAARQATSPTYRPRYDIVPLAISDRDRAPSHETHAGPGQFGLQLSAAAPLLLSVRSFLPATAESSGAFFIGRLDCPWSQEAGGVALSLSIQCRWTLTWSIPLSRQRSARPRRGWSIGELVAGSYMSTGREHQRTEARWRWQTASRMGLSSLWVIPHIEMTGRAPSSVQDARSHLGESEWRDLEAALRFVAERGGTKCVVFGWSLGATMALNAVQRSPLAEMITGIVMVSPVLVWEDVMRANAGHQRCPTPRFTRSPTISTQWFQQTGRPRWSA